MFSLSRALLLIVGLGFLADLLGGLASPLSLFMGLGFLALGLLTVRRRREKRFRPAHLVLAAAIVLVALVLLGLSSADRVNRLLCAGALLVGCQLALTGTGRDCRGLHAVASIALVSGVFFLILRFSPPAWKVWTRASIGLTRVVGGWVHRPVRLSPTYSGFNVTAFFVIASVMLFAFSHRRSWTRLGLTLVYLAASGFLFILLMTLLPDLQLPTVPPEHPTLYEVHLVAPLARDAPQWLPVLSSHVPWDVSALLFLAELPALWVVARGAVIRRSWLMPSKSGRFSAAMAVAMALFGVGLLVVRLPERPALGPDKSPKVVFYDPGPRGANVNFEAPKKNSYGPYSGGMLGRLPVYLEMLGFRTELIRHIDRETLAEADIVAIFSITEPLGDDSRAALWDFVDAGGSLLVVGDHTHRDEKTGEDHLEHLLEPCHIRFNFDSAHYRIGGWMYGYDYRAEPLFHGLGQDLNQALIGIGASLDLHASAQPMLLGREGFSDEGNPVCDPQRRYLGDMRYRPGERLGDLVLMAQEQFGAGRVIVVGDTGPFWNLFMADNPEVTTRLFAKLAARPVIPYHILRLQLALTSFLIALIFFFIRGKRSMLTVLAVCLVAAGGMQLMTWWAAAPLEIEPREATSTLRNLSWISEPQAAGLAAGTIGIPGVQTAWLPALPVDFRPGGIAWISGSQVELYAREGWRPDGLSGLYLNLMRSGLQPLRTESLNYDVLSRGRMLFLLSPTRRLSDREVRDIRRFMRDGGYVVVTADPRDYPAVAPLLKPMGLEVVNEPLGWFETELKGFEGMRVRFHDAFVIEHEGDDQTVLARWRFPTLVDQNGNPIPRNPQEDSGYAPAAMVEQRVQTDTPGRYGGLLFVGDARFLSSRNVESRNETVAANIGFIGWLVSRTEWKREGWHVFGGTWKGDGP